VKLLRLRVRSRAWFRIKEPKQTVSLSQSFQHPKSCLFTCTLPAPTRPRFPSRASSWTGSPRTAVSIFHVHRSPLSLIMRMLHNIGLAKMQTESRTFGRTIFDGKWPRFTEKAERPEKSHHFGKPSFAALTVQLCGDQPNKPIP